MLCVLYVCVKKVPRGEEEKTPVWHRNSYWRGGCELLLLCVCVRLVRDMLLEEEEKNVRTQTVHVDATLLAGAMGFLGKLGVVMANVILKRAKCHHRMGDVLGECVMSAMHVKRRVLVAFDVQAPCEGELAMHLARMVLHIYKGIMDLTKKRRFVVDLTDGFREMLQGEGVVANQHRADDEEDEDEVLQFEMEL